MDGGLKSARPPTVASDSAMFRGRDAMLRIGSAEGFYGDDVTRALPMIEGGHVDVVCFEALSELTLAILRRDQMRDPNRGYTRDIEVIAERILPLAFARKIPLITNGGGLNPTGAAEVVRKAAERHGLHGLKIATVTGDDLLARLGDLLAAGETLANMETGAPLTLDGPPIVTANAYLGAKPIVEALAQGADIVITGRVADPCLYLAPLIHHYGWAWDDWDKLASGIVCGHLLECTGQVVGGNSLALLDEIDARRSGAAWLSHRRGRERRQLRRDEDAGNAGARLAGDSQGATALRDARSARVHHAGCGGEHHDAAAGGRRP